MVKHTQTIRRLLRRSCFSVFEHIVGLALKELIRSDAYYFKQCIHFKWSSINEAYQVEVIWEFKVFKNGPGKIWKTGYGQLKTTSLVNFLTV